MGSDEFLDLCKKTVREYTEEHLDKTDGKVDFDVYAVWSCKALQNSKALASTSLPVPSTVTASWDSLSPWGGI